MYAYMCNYILIYKYTYILIYLIYFYTICINIFLKQQRLRFSCKD